MTEDTTPDPFGLADMDAINKPPKLPKPGSLNVALREEDNAAPEDRRPRNLKMKFASQALTRHVATCVDCGASNDRRNAQAWASIHVNANGGHRVALVLEYCVTDRDLDEGDRLSLLEQARGRTDLKPEGNEDV